MTRTSLEEKFNVKLIYNPEYETRNNHSSLYYAQEYLKNSYICPIYKTIDRQSTFVCFAQFKTKQPPAKWTIAGVAVILDCEKTDNIQNLKLN